MTPQEQQLLSGLTNRVNQTILSEKDPEAEQYLGDTLGRNPDALYILAQTVLVQQIALEQAKKQVDDQARQIEQFQQQAQQPSAPQKHTSFLGNLLGLNDEPAPPPAQPAYAPVQNAYPPQQSYPPPPPYVQPPYAQPGYGAPVYAQTAQPSFLGSAMRTAAGVAAGALAFEGVESMLHGFGHSGYGFGDAGFGGQPREEIINNNYYGDSDRSAHDSSGHDDFASRLSSADRDDPNSLSPDIEDRRDTQADFADTGSNDAQDFADTSSDDYAADDNSGDSGSWDDTN